MKAAHPNGIAGVLGARADKPGLAHLAELVPNGGHVVSMLGEADVEALAARGIKAVNVMTKTATDPLERLARLLEAGTITLPEIKKFPLDRAGEAFAEIEGAHVRGKLVVKP